MFTRTEPDGGAEELVNNGFAGEEGGKIREEGGIGKVEGCRRWLDTFLPELGGVVRGLGGFSVNGWSMLWLHGRGGGILQSTMLIGDSLKRLLFCSTLVRRAVAVRRTEVNARK